MEIYLARAFGFCFGVEMAIDDIEEMAREGQKVRVLGHLVHNPQVVERLAREGVRYGDSWDQALEEVQAEEVAVITAHGAPPEVYQRAQARGVELFDATCPLVHQVHRIARDLARDGYRIVVCGNPEHPEVKGILGWVRELGQEPAAGRSVEELEAFCRARGIENPLARRGGRVAMVFQTTQSIQMHADFLAEIFRRYVPHLREFHIQNTVCSATAERQPAALELARQVDVVLVVGGKRSANTRHLKELCESVGTPAYHIERPEEIDPTWLEGVEKVGVTAGASTPDWVTAQVVAWLEARGGTLMTPWPRRRRVRRKRPKIEK